MRISPSLLALHLLASASLAGPPLWKMNLPPAVRQAIRAEARPMEVEDVTYTVDEGRPAYEVDIRTNGVERSIEVGADGILLTRQVFLPELSVPVQQAIAQLQRFGVRGDIFWVDDDGEFAYAVEIAQGGAKRFFIVSLDGRLLATPVDLAQTPLPVQKAIQAQLAGGTLFSVDRVDDYGEISFEAAMLKNGQRRTFSVSPEGALIAQQVYLPEIPPLAQNAIQQYAGALRLAHIDASTEEGRNYYQARVMKNGAPSTLTVGQDGKLERMDLAPAEAPDAVRKTLQERAGRARLVKLEKVFEEPAPAYEAELVADGRKLSLRVSEDGKVE